MQNKPQVFCFTYAGGNATFFDEIAGDCSDMEFVKLEYAGHGTRSKEPLCRSFPELADDLFGKLKDANAGGPYALFGYSMGTISAVEVLARILRDGTLPLPDCVFLAAHEPRTKAELAGFSTGELDEKVKERTIHFGAVPEQLVNNRSFWRMYLPLLRSDYSMIGRYRFDDLKLQTEVPAVVFYSETDTPLREMQRWKRFFVGECEFFHFEGKHFFIKDHHLEMSEIMRRTMSGRENNDV